MPPQHTPQCFQACTLAQAGSFYRRDPESDLRAAMERYDVKCLPTVLQLGGRLDTALEKCKVCEFPQAPLATFLLLPFSHSPCGRALAHASNALKDPTEGQALVDAFLATHLSSSSMSAPSLTTALIVNAAVISLVFVVAAKMAQPS